MIYAETKDKKKLKTEKRKKNYNQTQTFPEAKCFFSVPSHIADLCQWKG